jgi:ArsR family transcriptional regulator, virulence genes transcriptional regulator
MPDRYNVELYKMKAQLCKTFADPTRLIIIQELRDAEKSVGDLQNSLAIPQAAVSRHLAVLRERGVVQTRREGTNVYYRLSNSRICEACDIVHEILIKQIQVNREAAFRLIGL